MAQQQMSSSQKALMLELKSLQEEPVEGFRITLVDESDLYNWEVAIFGPPNTLYEGGYFKVRLLPALPADRASRRRGCPGELLPGPAPLPFPPAGPLCRVRKGRGGPAVPVSSSTLRGRGPGPTERGQVGRLGARR